MASSVNVGPVPWMDGPTFNAQILRTLSTAATFFNSTATPNANTVNGGVIPGSGEFAVTAGAGMTVNVAAGNCLVPSSAGASQGGYLVSLMTNANLSIATSDPTNPRIDAVCATVVDNGNATSFAEVQVLTGTPAPSPAAPALPPNSIGLYNVTVPAGATSSSSFTIASVLGLTVPAGGVMPVYGAGSAPQGYTGQYIHDRSSGRFMHNAPSGPAQPVLLPSAPVMAFTTSPLAEGGTGEKTSLSLTVATDGNTDLKINYKCGGVAGNQPGSPIYWVVYRMYIDSSQVDGFWGPRLIADNNVYGGVSWNYYTSAAQGTRPSAGTHTVKVTFQSQVSFGVVLFASSTDPTLLRAEPVTL